MMTVGHIQPIPVNSRDRAIGKHYFSVMLDKNV